MNAYYYRHNPDARAHARHEVRAAEDGRLVLAQQRPQDAHRMVDVMNEAAIGPMHGPLPADWNYGYAPGWPAADPAYAPAPKAGAMVRYEVDGVARVGYVVGRGEVLRVCRAPGVYDYVQAANAQEVR